MSAAATPLGYSEPVWQRFNTTRHAGAWDGAPADVVTVQAGSPGAKFSLVLHARLADGRVADARFQAYGCPAAIAVGDFVAQWCVNRTAAQLDLTAEQIRATLEIGEEKTHCALMGEDLVRALKEYVTKGV